jgi:hypothetical protein
MKGRIEIVNHQHWCRLSGLQAHIGKLTPLSLVDKLRGAANEAAADGRPFGSEDWSHVLQVRCVERKVCGLVPHGSSLC